MLCVGSAHACRLLSWGLVAKQGLGRPGGHSQEACAPAWRPPSQSARRCPRRNACAATAASGSGAAASPGLRPAPAGELAKCLTNPTPCCHSCSHTACGQPHMLLMLLKRDRSAALKWHHNHSSSIFRVGIDFGAPGWGVNVFTCVTTFSARQRQMQSTNKARGGQRGACRALPTLPGRLRARAHPPAPRCATPRSRRPWCA